MITKAYSLEEGRWLDDVQIEPSQVTHMTFRSILAELQLAGVLDDDIALIRIKVDGLDFVRKQR